ncbi:MAG: hypothetical protein ACRD08_15820, partial [Acidimicrobiales bacterium]
MVELRVSLGEADLHLAPELGAELADALLQLRIETTEVRVEQVPELEPIGGIHLIEPLHELVRELVAEPLTGTERAPVGPGDTVTYVRRVVVIKSLPPEGVSMHGLDARRAWPEVILTPARTVGRLGTVPLKPKVGLHTSA